MLWAAVIDATQLTGRGFFAVPGQSQTSWKRKHLPDCQFSIIPLFTPATPLQLSQALNSKGRCCPLDRRKRPRIGSLRGGRWPICDT